MRNYIKQNKPTNLKEFAYFLAGLIDADGHINKKELAITFHANDISVAYYLKKVIGHGSIGQLKKKVPIILRFTVKKVFGNLQN